MKCGDYIKNHAVLLVIALLFAGCAQQPQAPPKLPSDSCFYNSTDKVFTCGSQMTLIKNGTEYIVNNSIKIPFCGLTSLDNGTSGGFVHFIYIYGKTDQLIIYDFNGSKAVKAMEQAELYGENCDIIAPPEGPEFYFEFTNETYNITYPVTERYIEVAETYEDFLGAWLSFCSNNDNQTIFRIIGNSPDRYEYYYYNDYGKLLRNITTTPCSGLSEPLFIEYSHCMTLNESRPRLEALANGSGIPQSVEERYAELEEIYGDGLGAFIFSCQWHNNSLYVVQGSSYSMKRDYFSTDGTWLGKYVAGDYGTVPEPIEIDMRECATLKKSKDS